MSEEDFKSATSGKDYEILESHNLTYDYGTVSIFKDSADQYYVGLEVDPDRGTSYFEHWKTKEENYKAYKKPTVESLRKLLSAKFFEETLFDVFMKKEKNAKVMHKLLKEPKRSKIENSTIKSWFEKNRKTNLDSKLFKKAKSIGTFKMPNLVYACQFQDDNILMVDVLHEDPKREVYDAQRRTLDIKKKEVTEGEVMRTPEIIGRKIVKTKGALPFFEFGKDYPIKPVTFGDKKQYKAKVLGKDTGRTLKVVISEGKKKLYTYEYPSEALLGRFWVFNESSTKKAFKNSVLFMYPLRGLASKDDYYILRFEVQKGKVVPMTKVQTLGDSEISFSPNGLMVYSAKKEDGSRTDRIKIVQL